MIGAMAFAASLARGASPPLLILVALVSAKPTIGITMAVVWLFVRRRRRPDSSPDTASYFDAVAAELKRGASLRLALAHASGDGRVARFAMSGQPMDLVAAEVHRLLQLEGDMAVAGIRIASRSGAPAAAIFSRLADRARTRAALRRQRRTLTAQARLSAAVVGIIPPAVGLLVLAAGPASSSLASGPSRIAVAVGVALEVAGLGVIGLLLRSHR